MYSINFNNNLIVLKASSQPCLNRLIIWLAQKAMFVNGE